VRDWLREVTVVDPLPETDRVGAVLDALDALPEQRVFRRLEIHTPRRAPLRIWGGLPASGRRLWHGPCGPRAGFRGDGQSPFEELPTLEILLPDFGKAIIAAGIPGNGSPHVAGVPRLRMPREAPSRSTLKLDEAWQVFIPGDRWETLLAAGQSAVDLGAAPGGWTWQLVRRGMHVDAVDNGPMDEGLMETGQVTHWREDAFSWRPRKRVDWLVCDIVDRPGRVVELIGDWIEADAFRYAIFNLKLPMKNAGRAGNSTGTNSKRSSLVQGTPAGSGRAISITTGRKSPVLLNRASQIPGRQGVIQDHDAFVGLQHRADARHHFAAFR